MTTSTASAAAASTNGHHHRTSPGTTVLPLELLTLPADNPRQAVGNVDELATSIAAVGLLEPIVVTPRDGGYLVVCGSRRYTATKQLKLDTVPVVVRDFDERERQEAMLIENLQREDLSVLEEAKAYQVLVDLGFSQRDLAGRLGRSQSHLSKRLALLKLPAPAAKALDSGGITLEDAQELLKLADMPKRMQKAFADGRRGSFGHCVRIQLQEHETAEKIGKETERLKCAGVKVLAPARDTYGQQRLPKGAVEISKNGGYHELKLDPAKHAKEPCHAAVVMDRWGTVVTIYVCTDRSRHPEIKTSGERHSGRNDATQKREREKQRRQQEAAKGRRAFIRALIAKRAPAGNPALAHLVHGFLEISQQDVLKAACDLLGIEPRTTKGAYTTHRDFKAPIGELASKGSAQLQRVALALGLAAVETRMEFQWISWGQREREHLDFLVKHGYELTAAERGRLPRPRRRRGQQQQDPTEASA